MSTSCSGGHRHRRGFEWFDGRIPPPPGWIRSRRARRQRSLARAREWLDSRELAALLPLPAHRRASCAAPAACRPSSELAPYDAHVAGRGRGRRRAAAPTLQRTRLVRRGDIVLLSDHGEDLGDHGEQEHGLLPLRRDDERAARGETARRVGRGRRAAPSFTTSTWCPTILDLLGAPAPKASAAARSRPILESPRGLVPDQATYAETCTRATASVWSELASITDDRYRFVKAPRSSCTNCATMPPIGRT